MSSRFPPLAPRPIAQARPTASARVLHALPLPLMELGGLCLFGLFLLI